MIPDMEGAQLLEPLGDFDFDFDRSSVSPPGPSSGHFIDEEPSSVEHLDRFLPSLHPTTLLHAPLPFRPHKTIGRSDRPASVISGNQLLHLEGRPARQERMATTAPTLKRKDKFCSNQLPQITRAQSRDTTYYLESPTSDAQRRMEQMNLHNTAGDYYNYHQQHQQQQQRPAEKLDYPRVYGHKKAWSEVTLPSQHHASSLGYGLGVSRDQELSIPQTASHFDTDSHHADYLDSPTKRHDQWNSYMPPDVFSVPPQQFPYEWPQESNDYGDEYQNAVPYPTPTSQTHQSGMLSHEIDYTGPLRINTNRASAYANFSHPISPTRIPQAPQTPPPSNPSASPGSPTTAGKPAVEQETQISPQKQARNNRRKQALRLQKSTAALKAAKSSNNLKTAKSTGNLKSRKSMGNIGGGGSGVGGGGGGVGGGGVCGGSPIKKASSNRQSQTQPLSLGFMNFTPLDSEKILTGVAPSGSSKTKARRELHEKEQKRRMSLAARKEIERLGGDLPAEFEGIDE